MTRLQPFCDLCGFQDCPEEHSRAGPTAEGSELNQVQEREVAENGSCCLTPRAQKTGWIAPAIYTPLLILCVAEPGHWSRRCRISAADLYLQGNVGVGRREGECSLFSLYPCGIPGRGDGLPWKHLRPGPGPA